MPFRSHMMANGTPPGQAAAITGGGAATFTAAGSSQANAAQLSASWTIVTTATSNQGVLLPLCEEGAVVGVFNNSGQTIIVYPHEASGVTINNAASSLTVTNGQKVEFVAFTYNNWVGFLSA